MLETLGKAQPLAYDGPLDTAAMFRYFSRRAIAGVEVVDLDALVYRRSVRFGDQVGVIEIQRQADDVLTWRSTTALSAELSGEAQHLRRIRSIFGLDQPLNQAYEALSADNFLAPLIKVHRGVRVAGTWDPFETGVRTIVGQQVSVAGASTIAARLVQRLGSPLCPETAQVPTGWPEFVFPNPETVAESNLEAIGMPQARVNAVRSFAAAVASGEIRLVATVPLEELVASICAVKGLGPWTANYIAMRLGHHDAFPSADLGLRKAAALSPDDPNTVPTTSQLETRSKQWQPWRSQAAMLLWHKGS